MPNTIELRRHRTINAGKVFDVTLPLEQPKITARWTSAAAKQLQDEFFVAALAPS